MEKEQEKGESNRIVIYIFWVILASELSLQFVPSG